MAIESNLQHKFFGKSFAENHLMKKKTETRQQEKITSGANTSYWIDNVEPLESLSILKKDISYAHRKKNEGH